MRKILFVLLAVIATALPALADNSKSAPTYVAVATFTPAGVLTTPVGFVNGSSTQDVYIKRIEMAACSTGTITGGSVAFWIYPSTTIVNGGIGQTNTYKYESPNRAAPSGVVISTGPVGMQVENTQTTNMPMLFPCVVNNDETAAANLHDMCFDSFSVQSEQPVKLPARANRGIYFEQRQQSPTNITAGCVMARIVYTTSPD